MPLAVTLYRFAALFLVFAFAPGLPHVVTTAEGATDFATGADVIRGSAATARRNPRPETRALVPRAVAPADITKLAI